MSRCTSWHPSNPILLLALLAITFFAVFTHALVQPTEVVVPTAAQRELLAPHLAKLAAGPGISVSGLSSGAFFTVQLSVAFSRLISNAGVVAGGAYNAAQGTAMQALVVMEHPEYISLPLIYGQIATSAMTGLVDPPAAMAHQHSAAPHQPPLGNA